MQKTEIIFRKKLFVDSGLLTEKQVLEIQQLKLELQKSFLKIALDFGFVVRSDYKKELASKSISIYEFQYNSIENYYKAKDVDINFFLDALIFPIHSGKNGVDLIVADPSDQNNIKNVAEKLKAHIRSIQVADDLDILKAIHMRYGHAILEKAVFELYKKDPESSAIETFTLKQIVVIGAIFLIFFYFLSFFPKYTLLTLNACLNLFLFVSIVFKFALTLVGSKIELEKKISKNEIQKIKNEDLPFYTILLPVFKESEVIYKLAWNLKNLNYPNKKLDVKLLIESDDEVTLNAVKKMKFPATFEPIIVPYSLPKTKPKACNYGLYFSKGKYLTIYDAEDIPESDQLKQVYSMFEKLPDEYIAIQCALNYFNKTENFLTKMFTLEYSYWFDYMLPGLDKLKIPIPLGGTSNHFKFDKLMELGGWDGFNVTEDADLGLRSYAKNYKITILDSTTHEEANNEFYNWIRQRSRWIKGYMQTYLVHMRKPLKLLNTVGIRGFLGFNFFIGGTIFTFLTYPILLAVVVFYFIFKSPWISFFFPDWLIIVSIINFTVGNLMMVYMNMIATFKRRSYALILYAIANPVYWIMHSISAYKGLFQLITKPFYWEKTNHGLTKAYKTTSE